MRQYPLTCGNIKCQTTQTPLWRKGWVTPEGKTIMLCNACGLHYKKGHSCSYCNQIYRESDADDNSNPWIGCDRCSRWTHQKCEERNGYVCKEGTPYMCPECRTLSSGTGGDSLKISVVKKRRRKPTINSSSTPTKRKNASTRSSNTPSTPLTPPSASTLFSQMVIANLFNSPGTPLCNGPSEHQWTSMMNSGDEVLPGSSTLNALIGAEAYGGYNSPSANNSTGDEEEPLTPTRISTQKRRVTTATNRVKSSSTPQTPTKKRRSDQDNSTRKKRKTVVSRRKPNPEDAYEVSQVFDQETGVTGGATNNIKFMQMLLEHQVKVQNTTSDTTERRKRRQTKQQFDEQDYSDGIDEDADRSGTSSIGGDDMTDEPDQLPKKKRPTRSAYKKNVIVDEMSDSEDIRMHAKGEETEASDNEEIIMLEDKDFGYPKVNVTKIEAYNYIKKHAFGISKVPTLRPLSTLWAVCSLERKTLTPDQTSDRQSQGAK